MVRVPCEICNHDHDVDQEGRKLLACREIGCRCGNRRKLQPREGGIEAW